MRVEVSALPSVIATCRDTMYSLVYGHTMYDRPYGAPSSGGYVWYTSLLAGSLLLESVVGVSLTFRVSVAHWYLSA